MATARPTTLHTTQRVRVNTWRDEHKHINRHNLNSNAQKISQISHNHNHTLPDHTTQSCESCVTDTERRMFAQSFIKTHAQSTAQTLIETDNQKQNRKTYHKHASIMTHVSLISTHSNKTEINAITNHKGKPVLGLKAQHHRGPAPSRAEARH